MSDERYPEHEKLLRVKDNAQAIGEFLEWLWSHDYAICRMRFGDFREEHRAIQKWIAEYLGIDLKVLEREKRALLSKVRDEG